MKLILNYGDYCKLGSKYYLLFSYQTREEVDAMYHFIREEVLPNYSASIQEESEKKEFLMPFMVDAEGNALYGPNQINTRIYGGINLPEKQLQEMLNFFLKKFNTKVQVKDLEYSNFIGARGAYQIQKKLRPELDNFYIARDIGKFQEELQNYQLMDKMDLDFEVLQRSKELESVSEELPKVIQNIKNYIQVTPQTEQEAFESQLDVRKLNDTYKECKKEQNFISSMHYLLEASMLGEFQAMGDLEKDLFLEHMDKVVQEFEEKIKYEELHTQVYRDHLKTFRGSEEKRKEIEKKLKPIETLKDKKSYYEYIQSFLHQKRR